MRRWLRSDEDSPTQCRDGFRQCAERESLGFTVLKEFCQFFAIILWVVAALAFVAEWFEPGQGMAALGVAIVGVVVVNGAFSFRQAHQAEQALDALRKLLPHSTKAARDGVTQAAPAAELVPGDVFATGTHSAFGQIAHLTQTADEETSPLQKEIARVRRVAAALAS